MSRVSNLNRKIYTNKSELTNLIDAISCHESNLHSVKKYGHQPTVVYLLGLGNGLKVNLNNIEFENNINISNVHVTIKDPLVKKEEVTMFLAEKFKIPEAEIKIYEDCNQLIENCFIA